MSHPDILTVREAASAMRTTSHQILRLIHAGKLRAIDISAGGKPYWRIHRGWIDDFLAAGQQNAEKIPTTAKS